MLAVNVAMVLEKPILATVTAGTGQIRSGENGLLCEASPEATMDTKPGKARRSTSTRGSPLSSCIPIREFVVISSLHTEQKHPTNKRTKLTH